MSIMKDAGIDPRVKAILESAWHAFATYGFRKTSMDDIARGAKMSRAAIYLHYKNKEAIFRSLVEMHYADKIQTLTEALNADAPVEVRLGRAIAAQGDEVAALLNSPHGMELLDAGTSTAPDIVEAGEAGLQKVYSDWLRREAEAGRVRLSGDPAAVAATIAAALKGIKMTAPDYDTYTAHAAQLAALLAAGLKI
ncbi:transcriptional regulator, TetR family [Ruegeria marina]|uniref:Transcriptional regulator, TetR family n=2 Tax=Ruegeria marina TaxID=639004 RepID=A0A1G7ATK8_9RHOB|nr:transcriptional regulator, TetR family [Ruegeria marina]